VVRSVNRTCAIAVLATLGVALYTDVTQATYLATIGGFTVHTIDVLFFVIILCSAAGVKNLGRRSLLEMLLLSLGVLLLLSFFRGVLQVGNSAAGVAFRMYTVLTALIIFSYVWGRRLDYEWLFDWIVRLGLGISLLGVARLVFGVHAFISDPTWVAGDLEPRIFSAASALMLGQAALTALYMSLTRKRTGLPWYGLAFVFFFAIVVISNQRTATFSTIAGALALLAFMPRKQTTTLMCAGTLACVSGIAVFALGSVSGGSLTHYLPRSLQMIVLEEGSFGWRLDQWDVYFQAYANGPFLDKIIGQPFGVLRVMGLGFSTLTDVNPLVLPAHSGYLQLLLNVGAMGLLVFVSVLVLAFAQAIAVWKEHRHARSLVGLAIAILVTQTVYSFTYSFDNEQGLLLAVAVLIIACARPLPRRVRVLQTKAAFLQDPLDIAGRQIPVQRN